jgi:hypothetical protein
MPEVSRRSLAAALAASAVAIPPLLSARIAEAAEPARAPLDNVLVSVTDPRFGAKGDGVADDTAAIQAAIDFCFGPPTAPHGREARRNRPLYFPPGFFKISRPLQFARVRGAHIFGPGRFTASILQTTPNQSIFVTNGFEYSRIEGLHLEAEGEESRLIDLNWDNDRTVALQQVIFKDLYLKGGGIGIDIGRGNFMGSENLIIACYFERNEIAGLKTSNFNALQNTVVGGNFGHCGRAIWVSSGSVPAVLSTGFQDSTDFDIQIDNAVKDSMQLFGCRTESRNFVSVDRNPVHMAIIGCSQLAPDGVFIKAGDSPVTLIGCASKEGIVRAQGPKLVIQSSQFDRNPWHDFAHFGEASYVDISNVRFGTPDREVPGGNFIARRRIVASGTYDGNAPLYRESADTVIEVGRADEIIGVNGRRGVPVTVKLGSAARRNGVPVTIKDVTGTAAVSAIVPEFSGEELCDGRPGADFAIATAYGSVTFHPRAGGWYRLG